MKLIIILLTISIVVLFIFIKPFRFNTVRSEKQAIQLLQSEARKNNLKDYWATTNCISFLNRDINPLFYSIDIYEKHGGNCPGDPMIAPRTASFEVFKSTGNIEWYDVQKNSYIPFKMYLKQYSSK